MNNEELLYDLYYTKKNFDGINELYRKAKIIHPDIKLKFVKEWLSKQQTTQQTSTKVGKKDYLPIYSETPYSFQIDLTFFPRYKKQNNNYYVLFTAIEINSRFAYAYYSKDKEMNTILDFLKKMENKTVINAITCDEGLEFKNTEFKKFCEDKEITLYFVKSDSHKLGIINRFHRTIKDKLTKYFIATDSVKWTDAIDDIVYNYNHSINRGIGIEPYKVNSFIENEIITKKREQTQEIDEKEKIIKVGDKCRILITSNVYDDKQMPKYSNKIYEIIKLSKNSVYVMDKDKELKVKKKNIKLVGNDYVNKELKALDNANYLHKQKLRLQKESLDIGNVIQNRTRKR